MGNIKSSNDMGDKQSNNGHDLFYDSHTYRDHVVSKRPKEAKAKRAVVFLTIDFLALAIVLGILKNLTDAKQIIALIVGIWYLGARAVIITIKIFSFIGSHSDSIRKGWRYLKAIFKE